MSFVRVSRQRQRFNSGSTKGRRKPKPKPEPPPWDDTTSDLSVHKATEEEIKHRHEVHQSKNLDVIRLENQKMMIQRARARPKTPTTVDKRKAALLREVLYDHSQLQDILSKSDRVMAVVRDLFGDDPKISLLDTGGSFVVRHQCLTPRQSTLYSTGILCTNSIRIVHSSPFGRLQTSKISSMMFNNSSNPGLPTEETFAAEFHSILSCYKWHLTNNFSVLQANEACSAYEDLVRLRTETEVIFLLMGFLIIVTNSVLLLGIIGARELHKPIYFFLANLAVSDFCAGAGLLYRAVGSAPGRCPTRTGIFAGICLNSLINPIATLLRTSDLRKAIWDKVTGVHQTIIRVIRGNRAHPQEDQAGTGDAPNLQRYTGFPNVTKAPDNPSGSGPVIEPPEQPTQLSMLSQSIMDQSALNEVDTEREQGETGDEQSLSQQFESRLDLQRFRRFLELERQQDSALRQQDSTLRQQDSTISTIPGEQQGQQGAVTSTMLQGGPSHQVDSSNPGRTVNRSYTQPTAVTTQTPVRDGDSSTLTNQAINDTARVNRTMSRTGAADQTDLSSLSLTKLDQLKQVMDNLESEIADYEQQAGMPTPPPPQQHKSPTLRGYTTSLLEAITRLTRHIKESESQLRSEATLRHHLMEEIAEQRALVDVLTADIISTQEQYTVLRAEFDQYRTKSEEQINYLKHTLYAVMKGSGNRSVDGSTGMSTQSFVPSDSSDPSTAPKTVPTHLQPLQPAVLLSPPRQRNHRAAQQQPAPEQSVPTSLADLHQRVSEVYRTMGKAPSTTTPTTTAAIVISQPTEVSVVERSRDSLGTSPLPHAQLYPGGTSGLVNGVVHVPPQQGFRTDSNAQQQFTDRQVSSKTGRPVPVLPPSPDLPVVSQGRRGSLEEQLSVLSQQHTQAQRRLQQMEQWRKATGASPQDGGVDQPAPSSESLHEEQVLQQQIDLLLHKHEEAQARLQGLVQQQQQISLDRQLNSAGSTGTASTSTEFTQLPTSLPSVTPPSSLPQGTHLPVSPPISPIPFTLGSTAPPQPVVTWGGAGREIRVSVPRVEDLELTATSTPSPHVGNNSVARSSLGSSRQSPIPVGIRPVSKGSTEDGWFALSSHVS
ncbi:spindle and centriole associated protein 1 [Branchiostoma belcheri]|nr:spindle and centriole associated protein 1 [Branchiostoma belcheri]